MRKKGEFIMDNKKNKKMSKKQILVRIMALILCALMLGSTFFAIIPVFGGSDTTQTESHDGHNH